MQQDKPRMYAPSNIMVVGVYRYGAWLMKVSCYFGYILSACDAMSICADLAFRLM